MEVRDNEVVISADLDYEYKLNDGEWVSGDKNNRLVFSISSFTNNEIRVRVKESHDIYKSEETLINKTNKTINLNAAFSVTATTNSAEFVESNLYTISHVVDANNNNIYNLDSLKSARFYKTYINLVENDFLDAGLILAVCNDEIFLFETDFDDFDKTLLVVDGKIGRDGYELRILDEEEINNSYDYYDDELTYQIRLKESDNHPASKWYDVTVVLEQADNADTKVNSIKVTDKTLEFEPKDSHEYSVDGGLTWQKEGLEGLKMLFENLNPATEYELITRRVEEKKLPSDSVPVFNFVTSPYQLDEFISSVVSRGLENNLYVNELFEQLKDELKDETNLNKAIERESKFIGILESYNNALNAVRDNLTSYNAQEYDSVQDIYDIIDYVLGLTNQENIEDMILLGQNLIDNLYESSYDYVLELDDYATSIKDKYNAYDLVIINIASREQEFLIVDKLLVNNVAVSLDKYQYTFKITEDTTIEIGYKDIIEVLKGKLDGIYKESYKDIILDGEKRLDDASDFSDALNIYDDILRLLEEKDYFDDLELKKESAKDLLEGYKDSESNRIKDIYDNAVKNIDNQIVDKNLNDIISDTLQQIEQAILKADKTNKYKDLTNYDSLDKEADLDLIKEIDKVLSDIEDSETSAELIDKFNDAVKDLLKDLLNEYHESLEEFSSADEDDLENIENTIDYIANKYDGENFNDLLAEGKDLIDEYYEKAETETYTLNLNDGLSSDKESYKYGSVAIITVTVKEGEFVKSFIVDGVDEVLIDNQYSFIVTKDTIVEVEFRGITRATAIKEVAKVLGGYTTYDGGSCNSYSARSEDGRKWKVVSDASVQPEDSRGGYAGNEYKCELVSPICTYEDIETVQEIIRTIRRAGARVNDSLSLLLRRTKQHCSSDRQSWELTYPLYC